MTSGLTVWFLERGDVETVGASGLVFGYFAYVVVRGLFDRNLIDTLVGIVMGASFAHMLTVAVPGTPGVSWLGHLGGMIGGLAEAWLFRDRRSRAGAQRDGTGGAPDGSVQVSSDNPRADLHKELGDLGLPQSSTGPSSPGPAPGSAPSRMHGAGSRPVRGGPAGW